MSKKFILLMSALACLSSGVRAQFCATDEINNKAKAQHPEIAQLEKQLEAQIEKNLGSLNLNKFAKTTAGDSVLHVPIVFHIVHDYGNPDYVSDQVIYETVKQINKMYSRQNADTSDVIPTYKGNIPGTNTKYIGKANIVWHLATKDPYGNPSHGITRRRSYLTKDASDYSKFDLWAPDAYMNVWIVNAFPSSSSAAAYAYIPSTAAQLFYWDGVISVASYVNYDNTISHELGHTLNLAHPWGSTNNPQVECGDDNVDDTPPTKGHYNPLGCLPVNLYDTACATGYKKIYTAAESAALFDGDSTHLLVNYPDTVNAQNVMDYTYCSKMFTNGQVLRMRATLTNSVANRNKLITAQNLASTGALAAFPDFAPTPDFSISRTSSTSTDRTPFDKVYGCADNNTSFTFNDRSWNDTIVNGGIKFSFSNAPSATNTTINGTGTLTTAFGQPGWVTVTQQATGNNTGTNTTVSTNRLYVADPTPVNTSGGIYFEEFNTADTAKWPIFNYYNNNWKWEIVNNAGYYDHYSIRYKNFDTRTNSQVFTGYPTGDLDDFFSPVFDLSDAGYTTNCNLNFVYSGVTKGLMLDDMNDTLQIFYSTTCGNNWNLVTTMSKNELANRGSSSNEYTPAGMWDWDLKSIPLPAAAKTAKVMFRFRYRPHNGSNSVMGSGNHFYMDRIHVSSFPTGITEEKIKKDGIVVVPNPTTQGANLVINGGNGHADIIVTDVTGKVVYRTAATLTGTISTIAIPQESISVKGMYMVQLISDNNTKTEKLIVY